MNVHMPTPINIALNMFSPSVFSVLDDLETFSSRHLIRGQAEGGREGCQGISSQ